MRLITKLRSFLLQNFSRNKDSGCFQQATYRKKNHLTNVFNNFSSHPKTLPRDPSTTLRTRKKFDESKNLVQTDKNKLHVHFNHVFFILINVFLCFRVN